MLEPLDVDVAADKVADDQRGLRNVAVFANPSAKRIPDVGLDVGAVVRRVADLLALDDVRQRFLPN